MSKRASITYTSNSSVLLHCLAQAFDVHYLSYS